MTLLGLAVWFWAAPSAIPVYDLLLSPGPFVDEHGAPLLLQEPGGLSTDGFRVLVWSGRHGAIIIDENDVGHELSRVGNGPGEFQQIASGHISPMGVHIIDRRLAVIFFEDMNFRRAWRLNRVIDSTWPLVSSNSSDEFLVTDDVVIVPVPHTKLGEIASIYTHEGAFIQTIDDPMITKSLLDEVSMFGHLTHWDNDHGRIFVLYALLGELMEIDPEHYRITARHELESPTILNFKRDVLYAQDKPPYRKNRALFWDFQIYKGKGYASTGTTLHQIDLDTGAILAIYRIKAQSDEIAGSERGHKTRSLTYFAMMEDGRVVFADRWLDRVYVTKMHSTMH